MAEPTFHIPKEIITPIIQAHVNDAILKALGGSQQVMADAIAGILQTKVDASGTPGNYSSNRPWIDWAVGRCVKEAAESAIKEALANSKEAIRKQILAQMTCKGSPLIKQLAEGLAANVTSENAIRWRLNVSIEEPR